MSKIPKATSSYNGCRIKPDLSKLDDVSERKITFSFESIEKNEYFNFLIIKFRKIALLVLCE